MPQAKAAQLAQQTVAQLQAILGQANLQHPVAAWIGPWQCPLCSGSIEEAFR